MFDPVAYLKVKFLKTLTPNEVGLMAVSSSHDPLRVVDVGVLRQEVGGYSTRPDDGALSDWVEDNFLDHGIEPVRCGRIWVHTHPGFDPEPSGTDEQTFTESLGGCSWSVMCIFGDGRGGERIYARLRLRVDGGPRVEFDVPVSVDWGAFGRAEVVDLAAWEKEYVEKVRVYRRPDPPAVQTVVQAVTRPPAPPVVQTVTQLPAAPSATATEGKGNDDYPTDADLAGLDDDDLEAFLGGLTEEEDRIAEARIRVEDELQRRSDLALLEFSRGFDDEFDDGFEPTGFADESDRR